MNRRFEEWRRKFEHSLSPFKHRLNIHQEKLNNNYFQVSRTKQYTLNRLLLIIFTLIQRIFTVKILPIHVHCDIWILNTDYELR